MSSRQGKVGTGPPRFGPEAIRFLRALKRNNRREWFQPRKEQYESVVRAPMVAIIERLAVDLRSVAPEIAFDPAKSIFRIYRDTRFSEDKTPYKTHIAAHFQWRGLAKYGGAGLYFHVDSTEVWLGGGMYSPPTPELQAVREHIAANHRRLKSIVESTGFRRMFGKLEGERLQRVPRGFPADHPAADLLRQRQFLAGRELPASTATKPAFYGAILTTFRAAVPLIRYLNEPLAK